MMCTPADVAENQRGRTDAAWPRIDPARLDDPMLLGSLITHRCAISPELTIEETLAALKKQGVSFGAVVERGRVLGVVSRQRVDEMLGSRFGFALYGQAAIREFIDPPSLAITLGNPITEILSAMNDRPGAAFYDDVVVLEPSGDFCGFIHTRTLVQLQHELFLQKISRLAASTESLNRLNAELTETYKSLVDVSRAAGMAEVATGVLHNVGNVLNSLNVSVDLIATGLRQSKAESLVRLSALVTEQRDLAVFLTQDAKGRRVPEFLQSLAQHAVAERDRLMTEVQSVRQHVDHIKEIVSMQQAYATMVSVIEPLDAAKLMEDALRLNAGSLERHDVRVVREFQAGALIVAEKAKVLQILINLIRNAKFACSENGRPEKVITLRIESAAAGDAAASRVRLVVVDNGVGIRTEHLPRIFTHGFTTRPTGHGFGLHSSANAAREMQGALSMHSDGPGRGATFTLELPGAPAGAIATHT